MMALSKKIYSQPNMRTFQFFRIHVAEVLPYLDMEMFVMFIVNIVILNYFGDKQATQGISHGIALF